jgi:hypothetical protein
MKGEDLVPDADCLLVFVDDTGHERLATGHVMTGFGGCAVLARGLEVAIRSPWREVRRVVAGSPDAPLHASEFTQVAQPEHIRAVASFFGLPAFFRIAAAATVRTTIPSELELVDIVLRMLAQRIQFLVDRVPAKSLAVIFEHNERAQAVIEKYFGMISVQRDGKPLPTELCWMPKSSNEPALEVADFIMHAVHGQMRHQVEGGAGFRRDYEAVFMSVPRTLIEFFQVGSVSAPDQDEAIAGLQLR